jgi:ribosomal protein S18 acetylase RimI-like enzyme
MMMELLSIARSKGYKKIRLETSPVYQPRAYAFYRRLGFHEIPRIGDDPEDVSMEMVL